MSQCITAETRPQEQKPTPHDLFLNHVGSRLGDDFAALPVIGHGAFLRYFMGVDAGKIQ